MFLEIVTPDEKVFEGEVERAVFPGSDGFFEVMNNHAAMISTLGSGKLKFIKMIDKRIEEEIITVNGGVVEVLNNKVTVLVERLVAEDE